MKKVALLYSMLFIILCTGCFYRATRISSVAGSYSGIYQISIDSLGEINIWGKPDDNYDFSNWNDIKSVFMGYDYAAGVKKDGTVVITGNNEQDIDLSEWENISMVAFAGYHILGLKDDGTIVYKSLPYDISTDSFLERESKVINKVKDWRGISYLCAGYLSIIGITNSGEVVIAASEELLSDIEEKLSKWKSVEYVDARYDTIVGLTCTGDVLVAHPSILEFILGDYNEPFDDLKGAIKICLGDTFVAGLMPDGTLKVRLTHYYGLRPTKKLSKQERKKLHEENQKQLPSIFKALNNSKDVIDINSIEDCLMVLKKDGTVLYACENNID